MEFREIVTFMEVAQLKSFSRAAEKLGYSQVFDTSYQGHYLFARDGVTDLLADRPGVMAADTVKPGYTMNKAYFQYDPQDGLYHRYQYGGVHQGNKAPSR